jgi:hypothetical protein
MGFLAAVGGIFAGTLVAFLLGVILDYLQVRNVLPESIAAWMFLPYTSAFAGFVSSLLAVSLFARYLKGRTVAPAKGGTTSKSTAVPKGMEHVPGMPVFDVDAIRRSSGGAGVTPVTGQRPAPPTGSRSEQKQ